MQPRRHLAFAGGREARVKFRGDDQSKHPVAKKLEPLIISAPGAAVGEGQIVERQIIRGAADDLGQRPGVKLVTQKPSPMRLQRAAVNQLIGLSQLADPSVENMPTSA